MPVINLSPIPDKAMQYNYPKQRPFKRRYVMKSNRETVRDLNHSAPPSIDNNYMPCNNTLFSTFIAQKVAAQSAIKLRGFIAHRYNLTP